MFQEDKNISLLIAAESGVSRDPKDFLLLNVDGCFDLRTHMGDVDALNHDCKK